MKNIKIPPQFKLVILGLVFMLLFGVARVLTSKNIEKEKLATIEEDQQAETEENQDDDWITYRDDEVGFSFSYPASLSDTCCTMGGAASEEIYFEKIIVDTDTINYDILDQPFAGMAIYLIKTDLPFETYLENEKEALHLQEKDYILYMEENYENFEDVFIDDGIEEKVTIADKELIKLSHYSWDGIERYYYQLPNPNYILVIGKNPGLYSDKFTFEEVLSTFEFSKSQE